MADNNLSNLIPKGVVAESISNVNVIEFMKNMKIGCTNSPFKVAIDESGNYRFLIDAKPILNAIYMVRVRLDEDVSEFIVSVSAKRSSYEGSNSFQNTVRAISASNPGIISLERLELFAALSNDIGLIATFKSKNQISPDLEVLVSSIGASSLSSSPSTINYTVSIPTSVAGLKNEIEVYDDTESDIDLNTYRRSGVIRCQPATEVSRPQGTSGVGTCFISASEEGDEVHQVFIADDSSFHFRTIHMMTIGAWSSLFVASTYPRIAATGRFFISLTGSNTVRIPISNVPLNYDRHSVTITPENDLNAVAVDLEIYSRGPNYIDVGSSNKWDGTINWTVIEAYAPGMDPVYNLTIGRLDGQDMRPATSVDEGQTIRVVLSTQNLVNGSTVPFTITGVTEEDIGIPLTGQFVIKNSSAYVDIKILEDYIADGVKTLNLTLNDSDVSASISIKDTSQDPIFDIYFSTDPEGKERITKLNSGFQIYVVITAIGYRPGVEYELDFTGSTLDLQNEVIAPVDRNLKFSFDESGLFVKEIMLNPLIIQEQVIVVNSTSDVNLFDLYKATHGTPTKPVNVRFVNQSGNTIVASRTTVSGVTVGDFPANSRVSFDNYGRVFGRGGNGGFVEQAGTVIGLDGEMGGPAFDMVNSNFTFFIENYGSIYSGGGGGGATPTVRNSYSIWRERFWASAIGGCGGAPYGKTMGMSRVPDEYMIDLDGGDKISFWISKQVGASVDLYFYRRSDRQWIRQSGGTEVAASSVPMRIYNYDASLIIGGRGNANLIYLGFDTSRTITPGSGGDPGLDGTDGVTNQGGTAIVARGGKGGKAGYVIASNRKNVVLRNHAGLIGGY